MFSKNSGTSVINSVVNLIPDHQNGPTLSHFVRKAFLLSGALLLFGISRAQEQASANIGFGSPDIRYAQNQQQGQGATDFPQNELQDVAHITGWKGERLALQVVVRAKEDLSGLTIRPGELKLTGSADKRKAAGVIPASAIKTGFIGYVLSNGLGSSGGGCGIEPAVQELAHVVADGIEYTQHKDVAAGNTQPIWVSLQIPPSTPAGRYEGQLNFSYGQKRQKDKNYTLNYVVEVKNKTLASPADWGFHLDLWQYPGSIARVYQVEPWSAAHFEKMRPYMEMLAAAGQKVITTSIMEDPWNGQTYDKYESMVQWIKGKNGRWRYDYTIFDKWVSYMMKLGINQQINCYSMVPWNNKFSYEDEASGTKKFMVAKPGSDEYNEFWRRMLEDFAGHLKAKGWFDKTTIAMDERPLEAMEKVISLVKSLPVPFKMALAGSYHEVLDKDIYDYSITTAEHYDSSVLKRRLVANLPTTYYTCCSEGYPNTFSFSPPAEAAFIPLLAAKRHLNGYLRWAYNAWPPNPMTDARFGSWSSGDTYLVYPGPGSSIRFEQLIRGLQDFEKIAQLRQTLSKQKDAAGLAQLDKVLEGCSLSDLKIEGASAIVATVEEVLNK